MLLCIWKINIFVIIKSNEIKSMKIKKDELLIISLPSNRTVATKYLANYMYWFKWLEIFNIKKDTIKSKNLLVQSHISHTDTKLKDFRIREAIYL